MKMMGGVIGQDLHIIQSNNNEDYDNYLSEN